MNPITEIRPVGLPLLAAYPGTIGDLRVEGGEDCDIRYDAFDVKMREGAQDHCGGDCGESEDCLRDYGDSDLTCLCIVSNAATPYLYSIAGYVHKVEPDPEEPLMARCYYEVKPDYLAGSRGYRIRVTRFGASQPEDGGKPNYAEIVIPGQVDPAKTYGLRAVRHPEARELPLENILAGASLRLRQDLSENPDVQQTTLKERFDDPLDSAVPVHYHLLEYARETDARVEFDECNPDHWSGFQLLDACGYDLMTCERVYSMDHRPPGNGLWGLANAASAFIWLSVVSRDLQQTFAHETGHVVGLGHDDPGVVEYNVMWIGDWRYGADVNWWAQKPQFVSDIPDWL
ncbi:MAG TPA: hypothetical protein PKI11_10640 [Candidatus Hydrogenedentes bacterium]|nr:hypothetical protein [Candidatus Hydrogenedentota bacterium]